MASCAHCSNWIIFDGKHFGRNVYCSDTCLKAGQLVQAGSRVNNDLVRQQADAIFGGECPKCSRRRGPVDIRKIHMVWSLLIITRWGTNVQLSCQSCAMMPQVGALAFCAVAGWWGFPWGLVMTPVQMVRNVGELLTRPKREPSADLMNVVRLQLAAQAAATPPPLPPPLPTTAMRA